MPIFCGCVSSKQTKSPDKKAKKRKTGKRDKDGGTDTIQNGGERPDDPAEHEQPASPEAASRDVSLSQVDVTEPAPASSTGSTSERSQSFPARPATIVKEDCLITEIEEALGTAATPRAADKGQTKMKAEGTNQTQQPPQPPPSAITPPATDASTTTTTTTIPSAGEMDKGTNQTQQPPQPPPSVITPPATDTSYATSTATTATTITTTTTTTPPAVGEMDNPQESEEPPPTLPPRPKTLWQHSAAASEPADKSPAPNSEPPPSLPPRTVAMEKPAVASSTGGQTAEMGEEAPPLLPPRCVPPSPPRAAAAACSSAPPKPRRCSLDSGVEEGGIIVRKAKPASFREPPPLPEDWAIIELPKTDAELLRLTRQPEQLATIASQYVVKHINLHTDVRVTAELSEHIYTAFLEVSRQHGSILRRFLTDLIEEQANSGAGDSQPAEPSHGAVIVLVREILRQCVSRESVVAVSLQVLEAVSGVGGATEALEECQVTGAVLGAMSAHKNSAPLHCSCLHVLARLACFPPSLHHKAPVDQLGTDLVCLSLEGFPKSVAVVQAACHVLCNLVSTGFKVFTTAGDSGGGSCEEHEKFLVGLLSFMDYVFTKCLPAVRNALKCHDQDASVKSYGRQFLVSYSQLELLRQRKKQQVNGSSPSLSPPPLPARRQGSEGREDAVGGRLGEQASGCAGEDQTRGPAGLKSGSYPPCVQSMEYENWDLLRGVLKKKSSLRGHPYSKPDLHFMLQLTKTQVVALVCALAVDGLVQDALKLLDQPVAHMVLTTEVPPGVRDFVAYHCSPTHTLIDLDPGLFVSLIDAVRYPSLSYQMAQSCVLEVAGSVNDQQQAPVVAVTVEFLASTITNPPLAPAMTVPGFVHQVCQELERARAVSSNSAALTALLSEIRQCARKTAPHH